MTEHESISERPGMFYCDRCRGEFSVFEAPGRCPLCDQWVSTECSGCAHTGPSNRFIDAGYKCPKCGRDAKVPGRTKTPVLLVAGLIVSVVGFALLIYFIATRETVSRDLPDLPTRSIETPP